mgnify:CR=1 FL=1
MNQAKEDELIDLLRGQSALLQEAYSVLEQEEKQDQLVWASIRSNLKKDENDLPPLDPARLFDLDSIRNICVKYRLRFLPSGRFKGPIPQEAVMAVRQVERQAGKPVKGFMIMAPAERFQLCDSDADPMLFIPVGNNNYYLLHRWGRDMHPLRAWMGWPVRHWPNLVITALAFVLLLGALAPTSWLTVDPGAPWWGTYRFGAIFCTAMLVGAATSFGWFAFFGQFSKEAWNSKTFN